MHKNLLLLGMSLLTAATATAYDFSADNPDGVTIYYGRNPDGTTVYVTYPTAAEAAYAGNIVVPTTVNDGSNDYSVTGLGLGAFAGSPNLEAVTLSADIKSIGDMAFKDCTDLTDLTVCNYQPWTITMGTNVFENVHVATCVLHVPDGTMNTYRTEPQWKDFAHIEGIPVYDFAVANDAGQMIYYNLNTDGASVTVTYKDTDYKSYSGYVEIPESVTCDGTTYTVTKIGKEAFYNCKSLYSVTFPATLTSIGKDAFHFCTGLTILNFPDALTEIGEQAFAECTALSEANFGSSLSVIGKNAFWYCTSLTDLSLGAAVTTVGDSAFSSCSLVSIYIPASVTSIEQHAFALNAGLADVTVAADDPAVINLGADIFYSCPVSSATLYVPEGKEDTYRAASQWSDFGTIEIIREQAYDFELANADGITLYYNINPDGISVTVTYRDDSFHSYAGDVVIPASVNKAGVTYSVTAVGEYAFYECDALTSVTIPTSVTSIGDSAFYGSTLSSITVPSSITSIDRNAFYRCPNLTEAVINANITTMGDNLFYQCGSLTSVILPETLTAVGLNAFYACSLLTEVNLPSSVTEIGGCAFWQCSSLTQVVLPQALTTIGNAAFGYCSNLTDITIPESVTQISDYAFWNRTGLTWVKVENQYPIDITLGEEIFRNVTVADCTLYVPEGSKLFYEGAEQWKDFGTIVEFEYSGTQDVISAGPAADAVYFDLTGRRVERPTRGFYITNGHKVFVK